LTVALIAHRPSLFPTYREIFFLPSPVFSVACVTLMMYLFAALHEVCHWAAARAAGLQASITVSRRLYFLAFETDLTRLWALPRRQRYGPLLAGMAFDTLVLCAATVARAGAVEGWWYLAPELNTLLGALAFTQVAALAAQCFVFMRTDVYALLITATGCVNLWRVNQLRLLRMLRRASETQRQELDSAHPRDLQVARWYTLLYVAGLALAAAFLLVYFLPATVRLFGWVLQTVMAAELGTLDFWASISFAVIVLSPRALTVAVIARDVQRYLQRRRTA
jgi:putative peptide zinc metalloprotease protein